MLAAKVEVYLKDYDNAMEHVDTVITANPTNSVIRAYKASLFILKEDLDNAIEEQKIATKNSPDALVFRTNLANLYLKKGDLESAKKEFQVLNKTHKDNIDVMEVEGRIEFLAKNYQKASELLLAVYRQKPVELVLLELLTSLEKTDRALLAINIINTLENSSSNPLPIKVVLKKAELYTLTAPEKAIALYTKLESITNGHYMILNNLAWLYLKQGNHKQALDKANSAIKSAPNEVAIQDTYGVMLLSSGDKSRALEVLAKVYEATPTKASYKVHYAEALLENNDKSKAKELIEGINKLDLDDDALTRLSKITKRL
ncbi:tetratricopeptide repeat protein [Colwellia sp. MSW7]|uniref:Tetratricopeptide repeat protein n=1 Tax=Colwellia maritima TaxID=2912588 RepID=A0ABS9WWI3_9GAMM|nr:tetratricopeptide repeat protein [Colwellia maritima]MCI2282211.1 tetratricopeptide repeat protein [Colwellia maritima]